MTGAPGETRTPRTLCLRQGRLPIPSPGRQTKIHFGCVHARFARRPGRAQAFSLHMRGRPPCTSRPAAPVACAWAVLHGHTRSEADDGDRTRGLGRGMAALHPTELHLRCLQGILHRPVPAPALRQVVKERPASGRSRGGTMTAGATGAKNKKARFLVRTGPLRYRATGEACLHQAHPPPGGRQPSKLRGDRWAMA